MPYDTSLVPARLLTLATDTARALGPDWSVTGLLSTAIVVHPFGLRVQLRLPEGGLRISTLAAMSSTPGNPAEITATMPIAQASGQTVAELIHSQVLPRLGRRDAYAALRLLTLPLRSARIAAVAQAQADSDSIVLHKSDDGEPVIRVRIPAPYGGTVGLLLDRLSVDRAIRCAEAAPPEPHTVQGSTAPAGFAAEVYTVLDALPALRAAPSLAGPRFTILRSADQQVTVRHDANATDPAAPMALFLPAAPIATAYAVLRAYTA
ncbi:hypothetical protein ACFY12_25750 [Streptomyces sp. NPDC001339]|uniref:hypothetical protein n=1 Tax=Streptomyces sp. NPDC001339 TaxID=3364563 RepID=UPI0036C76351